MQVKEDLKEQEEELLFPEPRETVRADKIAKVKGKILTSEEAKVIINSWSNFAEKIAQEEDHSKEIILSIYDRTGNWPLPYAKAGYKVALIDISHGYDVFATSPWNIIEDVEYEFPDAKIVGILSAPPCTSFASSGAWAWPTHDSENIDKVIELYGNKASQLTDKPIEAAEMLAGLVSVIIEFAIDKGHPVKFYALENPTGRIRERINLPKPTLTFQPNCYGEPYTKRTHLWGEFNPNLPQAYVEPIEGSKITEKLSGKDKAKRAETPLGFAYSFFVANNTSNIDFRGTLSNEA